MPSKFAFILLASLIGVGCAASGRSMPAGSTPSDELNGAARCLEHVLEIWPDFAGGEENFATQLSRLQEIEGDHGVCNGLSTADGTVRLSTGESLSITRMKSDFRCECLSIWVPYFFVKAGEDQDEIVVEHPDTPDSCEALCTDSTLSAE